MRRLAYLAAILPLLTITACKSGIDDDEHLATSRNDAGMTGIAVINVVRWDDIAAQLQTNFSLTADDAFSKVVPTSAFGSLTVRDIFGFSAGVGLPTSTLSKSTTTTTTDGSSSQTATKTRESGPGTAPAAPSLPDATSKIGTALPSASDKEPGVDPALQYQAAKALFEEVKLLNNAVKNVAVGPDETAYVVRLKVGVIPFARRQPYDVYTRISFFLNGQTGAGPNVPAPAFIHLMKQQLQTQIDAVSRKMKIMQAAPPQPGLSPEEANKRLQKQLGDAQAQIDDLQRSLQAAEKQLATLQAKLTERPQRVRVIPLLASDVLEASLQSRASDEVRQFGLALSVMLQGVGANIDTSKLDEILKAYKARDYSSLFTLSPLTETSVQARFGAQFNSAGSYTMQEHSQYVTVLLIAPNTGDDRAANVQVVARSVFRNVHTGETLETLAPAVIATRLKKTVMPLFINPPLTYDASYDGKMKNAGCDSYYDAFKTAGVDPQTAFLRGLYGFVQTNNYPCFSTALNTAGEGWKTPYWQTLWSEMTGAAAESEYAGAAFTLPQKKPVDFSAKDKALLLDDGKQYSRATIWGGPQIAPTQAVARLDVGGTYLYGAAAAGPGPGLLNLTFPSLQAASLAPTAGDTLPMHLLSGDGQDISITLTYKAAAKPAAAKPAFTMTSPGQTIAAQADASGHIRLTVAFGTDKSADGTTKRLADSVVISATNASITGVSLSAKAKNPNVAQLNGDYTVTVTDDAVIDLALGNLSAGHIVTIGAAAKLGAAGAGSPQSIAFSVAAAK